MGTARALAACQMNQSCVFQPPHAAAQTLEINHRGSRSIKQAGPGTMGRVCTCWCTSTNTKASTTRAQDGYRRSLSPQPCSLPTNCSKPRAATYERLSNLYVQRVCFFLPFYLSPYIPSQTLQCPPLLVPVNMDCTSSVPETLVIVNEQMNSFLVRQ